MSNEMLPDEVKFSIYATTSNEIDPAVRQRIETFGAHFHDYAYRLTAAPLMLRGSEVMSWEIEVDARRIETEKTTRDCRGDFDD